MIRGLGLFARNAARLGTAGRRGKGGARRGLRLRLRRRMTAALAGVPFAAAALAAMAFAALAARLAAAARTIAAILALAVLARTLAIFGCVGVNFVIALGARNLLADQ